MNVEKLNQWLVLAANLGVLTGIIFLATEVNQNTIALRSQALQARTVNLNEVNSLPIQQEQLVSGLIKLQWISQACKPQPEQYELIEELTPEETLAIRYWFRAHRVRTTNLLQQVELGALTEDYLENTLLPLASSWLPWWDLEKSQRTEVFRRLLDEHDFQELPDPEYCVY